VFSWCRFCVDTLKIEKRGCSRERERERERERQTEREREREIPKLKSMVLSIGECVFVKKGKMEG
jgi:hypothetical protein